MLDLSSSQPVYIGFCGEAGSGKTSTANSLVPMSSFSYYTDKNKELNVPQIIWDHFWFSMPIYEMSAYIFQTEGKNKKDRIMYALHDVLNEVMKRRIPYDDLVELVYDIYSLPCDQEGTKPRSFLQTAGSMCRNLYTDCFADYIKYKVFNTYRSLESEYSRSDIDMPAYIAIVSDVRMPNEAAMIRDQHNNLLIKFTASREVLNQRLMDRDGILMTEAQSNHESERGVNEIPDEWFDLIIDSTGMTVEQQAQAVRDFIEVKVNG